MQKYTIQTEQLVGFVAVDAPVGSTEVLIRKKCDGITSDKVSFHVWMHKIYSMFLSKTSVPMEQVQRFLIVLHIDNKADVYINDFLEVSEMTIEKPVVAGEMVTVGDISDISKLVFPDIQIHKDDAVIYCTRHAWRFSLYFDFERDINIEKLRTELGELMKEAIFYSKMLSVNTKMSDPVFEEANIILFTEGKTDVKHVEAAQNHLDVRHKIAIWVDDNGATVGSDELLKMCKFYARVPQTKRMIFIFDRDEERILRELEKKTVAGTVYQSWGNNVYSFAIPVPNGRSEDTHAICMELFYSNSDLTKTDEHGRRLYLSDEFDSYSCGHNSGTLHCTNKSKLKGKISIIDSGVFNMKNESVALSKDGFAEEVLRGRGNFTNTDFSAFNSIFEVIDQIAKT